MSKQTRAISELKQLKDEYPPLRVQVSRWYFDPLYVGYKYMCDDAICEDGNWELSIADPNDWWHPLSRLAWAIDTKIQEVLHVMTERGDIPFTEPYVPSNECKEYLWQ